MSDLVDPSVSPPARIAAADEGVSIDELRLAARNHGLPLEMLRHDVSPPGLHYLLVHYDIPSVDPASYRLADRRCRRPGRWSSTSPALLARPSGHAPGDAGVRRQRPGPAHARVRSANPGSIEAVGTADWTGHARSPPCSTTPASSPDAVDVVFTGADHGVERGVEQDYQRALPIADALDPRRPGRPRDERRAPAPAARLRRSVSSRPAGTAWRT